MSNQEHQNSAAEGRSDSKALLCCFCHKPFEPWHDGFEMNTEACQPCDMSYQEGSEFDRDNFGARS